MRRPKKTRTAAATVEFAAVVSLFFAFVFALVEFGRGMMVINQLNHAARAGCREGILPGRSNADISTAVTQALGNQGISGYSVAVKVNGAAANASTAQTRDEISVAVSVPASNVTWMPGAGLLKGTLTGRFALARE